MTDLILPDSLPGRLRCGSAVRDAADLDRVGVVVGVGSSLGCRVLWCMSEELTWTSEVPVVLDLTDTGGRVHSAWWLRAKLRQLGADMSWDTDDVCEAAERGSPMTDTEIEHLCAACLRAAGRTK